MICVYNPVVVVLQLNWSGYMFCCARNVFKSRTTHNIHHLNYSTYFPSNWAEAKTFNHRKQSRWNDDINFLLKGGWCGVLHISMASLNFRLGWQFLGRGYYIYCCCHKGRVLYSHTTCNSAYYKLRYSHTPHFFHRWFWRRTKFFLVSEKSIMLEWGNWFTKPNLGRKAWWTC